MSSPRTDCVFQRLPSTHPPRAPPIQPDHRGVVSAPSRCTSVQVDFGRRNTSPDFWPRQLAGATRSLQTCGLQVAKNHVSPSEQDINTQWCPPTRTPRCPPSQAGANSASESAILPIFLLHGKDLHPNDRGFILDVLCKEGQWDFATCRWMMLPTSLPQRHKRMQHRFEPCTIAMSHSAHAYISLRLTWLNFEHWYV